MYISLVYLFSNPAKVNKLDTLKQCMCYINKFYSIKHCSINYISLKCSHCGIYFKITFLKSLFNALFLEKESPHIISKFNPLTMDSALIRTLHMALSVSILTGFDCKLCVGILRKSKNIKNTLLPKTVFSFFKEGY